LSSNLKDIPSNTNNSKPKQEKTELSCDSKGRKQKKSHMDDENIRNSGNSILKTFPALIEERNVVYSEWNGPAEFQYVFRFKKTKRWRLSSMIKNQNVSSSLLDLFSDICIYVSRILF
jgi:hypothetical protein